MSLDHKHPDDLLPRARHCNANFCYARRFFSQIKAKWGHDVRFNHIILDYFFSPSGWAKERWTEKFFSEVIPQMATELLSPSGKLWLPNLAFVAESIELNRTQIEKHYTVYKIPDPMLNPLYVATENANEELLLCPDNVFNENQMPHLYVHSQFPFYALESTYCSSLPQLLSVDGCEDFSYDDATGYNQTLLMWDAISMPIEIRGGGVFLVRVFSGGKASIQSGPFHTAMKKLQRSLLSSNRSLQVEQMDTAKLCELKLHPKQFVDWYLYAHAYFFLAHIHQSLFNHNLVWDMKEAVAEFQRLRYHNGFPSGEQLRCPVFTQDKIKYIRCLGDLAINTMTVPLTADGTYTSACLTEVERYNLKILLLLAINNAIYLYQLYGSERRKWLRLGYKGSFHHQQSVYKVCTFD